MARIFPARFVVEPHVERVVPHVFEKAGDERTATW
jgi:hypothetical protein